MRFARGVLVAAAALLGLASRAPAAGPVRPPVPVLVLSECQPRQPICREAVAAIEATFSAADLPVELYFEHLDTSRLGAVRDEALAARYLAEKYAARPPALILANADEPARLLVDHRAALWPGAPVIAFALDRVHPEFPADVTQVTAQARRYAMADTVAAALQLVAGARTVTFVGGTGPNDTLGLSLFREQMRRQLPAIPVIEVTGLSMADTLSRVSRLPGDSVVYSFGLFVDGRGQRFVANEALRQIAAASNRPVFSLAASSLGNGIVGGYLTDFGAEARAAAQVALRMMNGQPGGGRVTVAAADPVPMFDWRQLRRWNLRERDLPPGSVVRYGEPSFLERYWWWLALAVVQTGFIAGLLVERRARKHAWQAAAASESLNRSVIASLPGMIAIVDRSGVVLRVNEAWSAHVPGGPGSPLADARPGDDCRATCAAQSASRPLAARFLDALDRVLRQVAPEATFEYAYQAADEARWFKLSVQALDRAEGGAVVAITDITSRKLAELEGRRTLQQAAHVARVTTMGELAASLAHEINQPLAAILTNAQAASRVLATPAPDLDLVRDTLDDIAKNDRRAGEIIRRMRSLLRKGETERAPVSLNDIARDVLAILGPEAQLRRVVLDAALAPGLPPVSGDAVQLQQVVLNLLVNAIDAVGQAGATSPLVAITTRLDGGVVELSVSDRGTGIDPGALPSIFNPFFTTKADGLGMGLSISRSIVEAHGGRITAENNASGGATFRCRFPVKESGEVPALSGAS